MKSKKILKIIIILIILIIIIMAIIGITLLILSKKNNKIINNSEGTASIGDLGVVEENIQKVENRSEYYIIKGIVEKYYSYCNGVNSLNSSEIIGVSQESIDKEKSRNLSIINDMLDANYKKENNITINNLESEIKTISNISQNIEQMNYIQKNENMNAYIVVINTVNKSNKKLKNEYLIIYEDRLTGTFSILPNEYVIANYKDLNDRNSIIKNIPEGIIKNSNNTFTYETIADGTYAQDMYDKYLWYMIYNPDEAYEILDKNYAKARFENKDDFLNYLKDNKKNIEWTYEADTNNEVSEKNEAEMQEYRTKKISLGVDKYLKTDCGDTYQYVLIDKSEKYLIINEKSAMNFTVMLDEYTIDLPQFTEKYNNANNDDKMNLNAAKVVKALQDKNYLFIYNRLNTTFKANNFETELKLKTLLQDNLFETCEFTNENLEKQNDIYIYTIKATNKDLNTNNSQYKIIKLMMRLGEKSDFEISFTISK